MALEDILRTINDEAERQSVTTVLDKYSPVKAALERGDALADTFNEMAALGADPVVEAKELPAWIKWRRENLDLKTMKLKPVIALESERDVLKARIAELEAERGTEMTGEEVKALANQMFEDKMKAAREDPNNPLVDKTLLLGSMNAQAKRFQEIYAALTPEAVSHAQKYGEPLPVQEVLDYIEKTGERDPKKAYAAVLAPRDTNLKIKQLEADKAAEFEKGKQKGIEEAQAKLNGQRHPVDGGGSQRAGSGFMNRIFKKRAERADAGSQRLGSGFATAAGMADHQKRLMGSGTV